MPHYTSTQSLKYSNPSARVHRLKFNVILLELCRPDGRLDFFTFEALSEALKLASQEAKGLVITGHGQIFGRGACLETLYQNIQQQDFEGLNERVSFYQNLNLALLNLPIPSVAAIHGTATGSALEMALHCQHRILTPSTRLGLPEARLGILPATGGTARMLARCHNKSCVYKAFRVLIQGTMAENPAEAFPMGYLDQESDSVCQTPEELLGVAIETCLRSGPPTRSPSAIKIRAGFQELREQIPHYGSPMSARQLIGKHIAWVMSGGNKKNQRVPVKQVYFLERMMLRSLTQEPRAMGRLRTAIQLIRHGWEEMGSGLSPNQADSTVDFHKPTSNLNLQETDQTGDPPLTAEEPAKAQRTSSRRYSQNEFSGY